jgi:hypothetical protein
VSAILHPPLSPTNLYFLSIMRIHEVKRGPFHEHSSQLYSIATGVATWKKVNSGLFKMYEVRRTTHNAVQQLQLNGGVWVFSSGRGPRKARGGPAPAVGRHTGVECGWRSAHWHRDWRLLEPHLYCDDSTSGTGEHCECGGEQCFPSHFSPLGQFQCFYRRREAPDLPPLVFVIPI